MAPLFLLCIAAASVFAASALEPAQWSIHSVYPRSWEEMSIQQQMQGSYVGQFEVWLQMKPNPTNTMRVYNALKYPIWVRLSAAGSQACFRNISAGAYTQYQQVESSRDQPQVLMWAYNGTSSKPAWGERVGCVQGPDSVYTFEVHSLDPTDFSKIWSMPDSLPKFTCVYRDGLDNQFSASASSLKLQDGTFGSIYSIACPINYDGVWPKSDVIWLTDLYRVRMPPYDHDVHYEIPSKGNSFRFSSYYRNLRPLPSPTVVHAGDTIVVDGFFSTTYKLRCVFTADTASLVSAWTTANSSTTFQCVMPSVANSLFDDISAVRVTVEFLMPPLIKAVLFRGLQETLLFRTSPVPQPPNNGGIKKETIAIIVLSVALGVLLLANVGCYCRYRCRKQTSSAADYLVLGSGQGHTINVGSPRM